MTENLSQLREEAAVLVVGAGPVGLTLACGLARQGTPCRVIDHNEGPTPVHESRALAIWERTQEVLADLGCIQPFLERGARIHGINAYAGGRRVAHIGLDLDDEDTAYPFVLSLPQSQTERILLDRHAELGGRVERRTRLVDVHQGEREVTAVLVGPDGRERDVRCDWLVGCDGAGSAVRHRLGVGFPGAEYEEPFRLADVQLQWNLPDDEGHILLLPQGTVLAAFPLPEPGRWRLVDDSAAEVGEDPAHLVGRFRELLHAHGHPEATLSDPRWATAFRIHRRLADHFRVGRCFLAGDAAHIHSPFGGQGMNTGIQDAHNLAWKLALVTAGASPESLLDSYEAERRPVARGVLRGTDLLTRLLSLRQPVASGARNLLASVLTEFGFVQRRIARQMGELDVSYRGSPIVDEDRGSLVGTLLPGGLTPREYVSFETGPRPGERAPDVVLGGSDGSTPQRLSERLWGTGHSLLLFPGEDRPAPQSTWLGPVQELVTGRYAGRVTAHLVLGPNTRLKESGWTGPLLEDRLQDLRRRFGAAAACLYLIRPDGYIGYRAQPPDPAKLSAYLQRIFR